MNINKSNEKVNDVNQIEKTEQEVKDTNQIEKVESRVNDINKKKEMLLNLKAKIHKSQGKIKVLEEQEKDMQKRIGELKKVKDPLEELVKTKEGALNAISKELMPKFNEETKLLRDIEELKSKKKGLEELLKDLEDNRITLKEEYDKAKNRLQEIAKLAISEEISTLEVKKSKLEKEIQSFEDQEKLKDEKKKLEVEQKELERKLKILKHKEESNDTYYEKIINEETERIDELKKVHNQELSRYKERVEKDIEDYNDLLNDYIALKKESKLSEEQLKEIEEYNENKKTEEYYNEIIDDLKDKNEELRNYKNKSEIDKNELALEKDVLERNKHNLLKRMALLEGEEGDVEALWERIRRLEEENKELKNGGRRKEAKLQAIEQCYFKDVNISKTEDNELDWLNNVAEKIKSAGFRFTKRLLYSFHTSLKISDWSILSVLAGVSGTGKSELPRLYSKYGGLFFLSLPVQPDWDSPQSLFGYYNSLEGKFNATSLLRVLYQAQKNLSQENLKDSIYDGVTIVLLDEMNLAHVELYFSELLSKLESLRGKGQEILEIDYAEDKPYEIVLSNNIKWVGTMNEDETTKSLSDKVIDRGDIISFPKPNELISRTELKEPNGKAQKLSKETWDSWKYKGSSEGLDEIVDDYRKVIQEINEILDPTRRVVAHRVWQGIENYIKNYPLVLANLNEPENLKKYSQMAFEDAIVQKIIPKLRGLDTQGEVGDLLRKVKNIIDQKASGISKDFENALKNPFEQFVWVTSSYLENEDKEESKNNK